MDLGEHVLAELTLTEEVPAEREERCTFVMVGGGYSGCAFAAQMRWVTRPVAPRYRGLEASDSRWVLVEQTPMLMPQLSSKLRATALRVLRSHGNDVRPGVGAVEVTDHEVALSSGERIPTRTLVWSAGVQPSALFVTPGRPTTHGRRCGGGARSAAPRRALPAE